MKKIFLSIFLVVLAFGLNAQTTFHSFTVKDINGADFALSQFKGKKVLVVNTASKCGLTPQYKELQELYEAYRSKGVEIVAFPANNFASQEPGTNKEILEFCTAEYSVTFPIMSKISVKGDDIHPLYKWLTTKEENLVEDSKVKWNFQKYLIDENGKLVRHFAPRIKPLNDKIIQSLTN